MQLPQPSYSLFSVLNGVKKTCVLLFFILIHQALFAQCGSLSISVDKAVQCAPSKLKFVLHGAPKGSSYEWNFGSGYISKSDTVYQFFLNPEVVSVDVRVVFPNKTTCIVSQKAIAEVRAKPIPTYQISRKKLCYGPDSIVVLNTTPLSKNISWIIDGTNYSNTTNAQVHYFKSVGTKSISMIVTDSFGCIGVSVYDDVAVVHPLVKIDFTADNMNGCVTKVVKISPTYDLKGETITDYLWEFDGADKKIHKGVLPPKLTYLNAGEYDVKLTATTANGCVHTVLKSEFLKYGDSLSLNPKFSDTIICLKQEVAVKTNINVDGNYGWTFEGDPAVTKVQENEYILKYAKPGSYKVSLGLSYNGCFSNGTSSQTIHVREVVAKFNSVDNYHCLKPHTTHLNNLSYHSDNSKLKYQWSYYNSSKKLERRAYGLNDSFTTNNWGMYDVQLIVEDTFGCKDTTLLDGFVRVFRILPTMESKQKVGCVDQLITVRSVTPTSSYISQDSFHWVIYDQNDTNILKEESGPQIEYTFKKPGFYSVKMYAGNLIGCIDSLMKEDYLEIILPEKSFELSDTIICKSENVEFNATTTPSNASFKFRWKIKDPSNNDTLITLSDSLARKRVVNFGIPGTYDITLYHRIDNGCYDTLTKKARLNVNGIKGRIELADSTVCDSFDVKPKLIIEQNLHAGDTSQEIQYEWFSMPSIAATQIIDGNSATPTFRFNKKGDYNVGVRITNSFGCADTIISSIIHAGVVARFDVNKIKSCVNDTIKITDRSSSNPTSYTWRIKSSGNYSLNASVAPVYLIPKEETTYEIILYTDKNGQCSDSSKKKIEAITVKSSFTMVDSGLFCAPAYAQFRATSVNANSYSWDFGDGAIVNTTDIVIAHIYERNTRKGDGYDIRLISKSKYGCADTTFSPNLVNIFGPVPEFNLKNFVGCEPLQVQFIETGSEYNKYFLNFTDGSPLDSTHFNTHTYYVNNSAKYQYFIPNVFVQDSLGCSAIYTSKDTIIVYNSPDIKDLDLDLNGCVPYSVSLKDTTSDIIGQQWFLDNKLIGKNPSIFVNGVIPGIYEIKLTVTNYLGCSDTAIMPYEIFAPPVIQMDSIRYCLFQPSNLTVQNKSSNQINRWIWELDDPFQTEETTDPEWNMVFTKSGHRKISVIGYDQNNCSDTSVITFKITTPDSVPKGLINYVTITENNTLITNWNSSLPKFVVSTILLDANNNEIFRVAQKSNGEHEYVEFDVKNPSCYHLVHIDDCELVGKPSDPHCPIILQVNKAGYTKLKLTWTPYVGWASIDKYNILRSVDGDSYELLASVDANVNEYLDTGLCDNEYLYFIQAVYNSLKSESNRQNGVPDYLFNTVPVDIERVTVDNELILVNWKPSSFPNLNNYFLEKWDSTAEVLLDEFVLEKSELNFVDPNVDVNKESYRYQVSTNDICDIKSVKGLPGRSILLNGSCRNGIFSLDWNPYYQWRTGVKYYDVQLQTPNGYLSLGTVNGNTTDFTYSGTHLEIRSAYCFRVVAHSYDSLIESVSNEVCLVGSSGVWVPNAFSPNNGDDLNSTFRPTLQFINNLVNGTYQSYSMMIFNRWGEKLFETNNLYDGWDGTYLGEPCPSSFYVYVISAKGLDNLIYGYKGAVHLLR